jgi:CMP-N,N'-diacetyllegionaminic acid synthase
MKRSSGDRPRALGVIPARGGSKRLRRKNILSLAGQPVISYTIDAAQKATMLTDYLVTSEDEEILECARNRGAPTPFVRPAHLATDEVRNIDTVAHALDFMERQTQNHYDIVVLLQPTCPIRDPMHIDEAVRLLWASKLPTLASVKGPYKKRDPVLKKIESETLIDYCGGSVGVDWSAFYIYNASIYAAKRDFFVRERKLISKNQVPLVMDSIHSIDIDTEVDLLVAEAFLTYLQRKKA